VNFIFVYPVDRYTHNLAIRKPLLSKSPHVFVLENHEGRCNEKERQNLDESFCQKESFDFGLMPCKEKQRDGSSQNDAISDSSLLHRIQLFFSRIESANQEVVFAFRVGDLMLLPCHAGVKWNKGNNV
jgi:hypothetical protein